MYLSSGSDCVYKTKGFCEARSAGSFGRGPIHVSVTHSTIQRTIGHSRTEREVLSVWTLAVHTGP